MNYVVFRNDFSGTRCISAEDTLLSASKRLDSEVAAAAAKEERTNETFFFIVQVESSMAVKPRPVLLNAVKA
jgi:hypothetical protein